MSDRAHPRDGGLSRRDLLTRGAIAGGLVWAAPVIRTTAAYATTANGTERPCINFYMVVITPDGQVHPEPGNLHASDVPPAIRTWFDDNPAVNVQFPAVRPQLTSASSEAAAVLLPAVTGPNAAGRQCRMVLGWLRKGNSFKEGYVDPNPPIAVVVGRRLLFPYPTTSSHVTASPAAPDSTATDSSTTTSTTTTTTTTTLPSGTDPAAAVGPSAGPSPSAPPPASSAPAGFQSAGTVEAASGTSGSSSSGSPDPGNFDARST